MTKVKINIENAQQGWYKLTIINSNGTESNAKIRLTKDDFKNMIDMFVSNNVNLEIYKYWCRDRSSIRNIKLEEIEEVLNE